MWERCKGGPASEKKNEWEIESAEKERGGRWVGEERDVFGSRTTHVTLPCPSLCFPHSLTWPELYPHHHIHIHKGLCLQTSPYLWFIAQWRAQCLLIVLPAVHGITSTLLLPNIYQSLPPLYAKVIEQRRTHRVDICFNFLRMTETFHFPLYPLYSRVGNMLSIILHISYCMLMFTAVMIMFYSIYDIMSYCTWETVGIIW